MSGFNEMIRHLLSFIVVPILLCTLFVSCGYRWGNNGLAQRYSSISVPYVQGDWDGSLTAAIVRQIARSGSFEYRSQGGELILIIKIMDLSDENIGFRYNRNKEGELKKTIIPVETRLLITAEVVVMESGSGCVVLEPVRLSASMDCDHSYYSSPNEVNSFSLGQLADVDAAFEAVMRPLYEVLAQKIVDYVS